MVMVKHNMTLNLMEIFTYIYIIYLMLHLIHYNIVQFCFIE